MEFNAPSPDGFVLQKSPIVPLRMMTDHGIQCAIARWLCSAKISHRAASDDDGPLNSMVRHHPKRHDGRFLQNKAIGRLRIEFHGLSSSEAARWEIFAEQSHRAMAH